MPKPLCKHLLDLLEFADAESRPIGSCSREERRRRADQSRLRPLFLVVRLSATCCDPPTVALRHPLSQSGQPPQASFRQYVKRKPSDEVAKSLGFPVGRVAYSQSSQKSLIVSYRTSTSRSAAIPFLCCSMKDNNTGSDADAIGFLLEWRRDAMRPEDHR
jgi:hypothetical protein